MFEYLDEDRNDEEKQCAMLSTLYWMACSGITQAVQYGSLQPRKYFKTVFTITVSRRIARAKITFAADNNRAEG